LIHLEDFFLDDDVVAIDGPRVNDGTCRSAVAFGILGALGAFFECLSFPMPVE